MSLPSIPFSVPGSFSSLSSFSPGFASAGAIITHPTADLGVIFALLAGALFWAFVAGRRKVMSSILMTYVALAVFPAIRQERIVAALGLDRSSFTAAGIFLGLFIILVLFLGARRRHAFSLSGPWWQTLFLSFIQMGLLIHIVLSLIPDDVIQRLSPLTRSVFTDSGVHIWWLIVPVVFLILIRRLTLRDE